MTSLNREPRGPAAWHCSSNIRGMLARASVDTPGLHHIKMEEDAVSRTTCRDRVWAATLPGCFTHKKSFFFRFLSSLIPSSTLAFLFCYFSFSLHFVRTSKGVRTHARTHTHFLSHSYMCIERKMLIKSPTE